MESSDYNSSSCRGTPREVSSAAQRQSSHSNSRSSSPLSDVGWEDINFTLKVPSEVAKDITNELDGIYGEYPGIGRVLLYHQQAEGFS